MNISVTCAIVLVCFSLACRIPINDVLVNFEEIELVHLQPDAITQGVALEEVNKLVCCVLSKYHKYMKYTLQLMN